MSLDLYQMESFEGSPLAGGGAVAGTIRSQAESSVAHVRQETIDSQGLPGPAILPGEGLTAGRVLEIVFASSLLVAFSPLMLVVAIALRLAGNVSVIYRQERVGLNGKRFDILKFRTMHADAEADGPRLTTSHTDARITAIGRILRKSKIDELPQLWNVVRGDMTIVGPRPERPCFHEKYTALIENWERRISVKPGITGLAQITVSHDPREKIVYDLIYIENRCWSLNFEILFNTVLSIFRNEEQPISAEAIENL